MKSRRGTANPGNLLDFTYNFNLGSGDNGNVMGITNNRDTTRSQAFTYDALNRLATATASTYATSHTHCWGESFGYDTWGNFLSIGVASTSYNGCTQENLSVTASAQNRIGTSGYLYDTAGNMTAASGASYTYDAENHLTATAGVTYTYDGDGKRVMKSNGKIYWYGIGSDALDETDLTGSTSNSSFGEYVFLGGRRIARRDSSNNVLYYAADHLGTSRVIAQVPAGQSTATLCYDADFYPFGGERPPYTNTCAQNYKFTGKERDTESNLDNFGKRYDSSSLGRFMSPDPIFFQASMLADPQRFNQYAYVRDNPLALIDPTGETIELNGTDEERRKQLEALRKAVGEQAGQYLYENKVETKDADGNKTTSYYVGVYTNGPDGKGPSFGSINSASNAIGNIISDSRVAQLDLVSSGATVRSQQGDTARIGPIGSGGTPGATYIGQDGNLHVTLLDTSTTSPGELPSDYMSNRQPGVVDAGILAGHEFGHVRYEWGGFWRQLLDSSNSSAVRLENDVRKLSDPSAPTRTQH